MSNTMQRRRCGPPERPMTRALVTAVLVAACGGTVSSCIAGQLGRIEFPKPKGGTPVTVASLPITFAPEGA